MGARDKTKGESKGRKDRLMENIVLAAKAREKDRGACPSIDELSALAEGELDSRRRESLFEHLNRCADCYQLWMSASADAGRERAGGHTDKKSTVIHLKAWVNGRTRWAKTHRREMAGGLALAASLLLFLILPIFRGAQGPALVQQGYQLAKRYSLTADDKDLIEDLSSTGYEPFMHEYGFSGSEQRPSDPYQAFYWGIISGMEAIGRDKDHGVEKALKGREMEDYFWCGRWFALLLTGCRAEVLFKDDFRRIQKDILVSMDKVFALRRETENEARVVTRSLERLNLIFQEPGDNTQRSCRIIRAEIRTVLEGIR